MYKHQVIGIRQENSWRSRKSQHIVGMCTMEAMDAHGKFEDFDSDEDWRIVRGGVVVDNQQTNHPGLTPGCRFWSLEEVLEAMGHSNPKHEFYTREPKLGKIPVFSYLSKHKYPLRWVKTQRTQGNSAKRGTLHSLVETPVDCPQLHCTVIPRASRPVTRGYGPDF